MAFKVRPKADTNRSNYMTDGVYHGEGQGHDVASHSGPSNAAGVTATYSSTDNIPYRGTEGHGLPIHDYPVKDAAENEWGMEPGEQPHDSLGDAPAINVRVVENNAPTPTIRKEFRTRVFPVAQGSTQAQRAVGRMEGRTSITIGLKSLDQTNPSQVGRIWVGPDANVSPNNGAPMDIGDNFSSTTTEDIWVALDPSSIYGTLLVIMMDYEVEIKVS